MIKINQIKLPVTHSDEALKKKIIKMLKLNAKTGFTYRILKKSLDARKKPELFYTYSVAVELDDTKIAKRQLSKEQTVHLCSFTKKKSTGYLRTEIYRLTGALLLQGQVLPACFVHIYWQRQVFAR